MLLVSCSSNLPKEVKVQFANLPEELDYNVDVKPILSDRCFACHGNDKNKIKAGLRLDNEEDAYSELKENAGKYAIVPKSISRSEVIQRIISLDPEALMPPPESNLSLSDYEKAVLAKWIQEGAEYKEHWAFDPPSRSKNAKVKKKSWIRNEIDEFVLAKLEDRGWEPSREAEKNIILRRLAFDITGLPPSDELRQEFISDEAESAYENAVDKLLSSASYGERMAAYWMDLARYADTHGYTVDRYRDMSPWRDWVIKSFNENMAYDDFVTWQLAGDLMQHPTKEQILATAFNRNHQQNMEGGIIPEEFRVEYVADRTNTLGTAFLGLTLECARCHDHKYDPISQKDYFELFSFFNNVNEAGQISWNNATPVPTLLLTNEETDSIIEFLREKIENQEEQLSRVDIEAEDFKQWLNAPSRQVLNKTEPIAYLSLDDGLRMQNVFGEEAMMKQEGIKNDEYEIVQAYLGKGLKMNGDTWLDLGKVGQFSKDYAFTLSFWINVPSSLTDGVIFHKGSGAALYNFRGLHLAIKDNRTEALIAHTAPDNAILKVGADLPRDKWIHLSYSYDGSSKAKGLKVYLNGSEMNLEIVDDNLFKDITFGMGEKDPGIQFGARYRGVGIKNAIIDEIKIYDKNLSQLEILDLAKDSLVNSLLKSPVNELDKAGKLILEEHFRTTIRPPAGLVDQLQSDRIKLKETIDTIPELMVMKEMSKPRQAYILERGVYDNYGEKVFPNAIENLLPFSNDLPRNRLGLADWLFDPEHPLTSRVVVNQIWSLFFERGLVKTADDFGNQGEMPSHPKLLDFLALELQESDWDIKFLIKKIVMSSTYRQSSIIRDEMLELDAENAYLWRGPSARLSAEMMRDNALAASGLLVMKIGGPSVKPYQPKDLWAINGGRYNRDEGENLYRRSLYTFWKRTVPNPTQAIFDAPSRSYCTVQRQKTNTPLQALVLLNDPAYVEASRAIGSKLLGSSKIENSISSVFEQLSGRLPSKGELSVLMDLRKEELIKFKKYPHKMEGWLNEGDFRFADDFNKAELAANTVVASAMINGDATTVKR